MTLTFVDEAQIAQIDQRISVLLYGPKGVGKTTGAVSAPGPILYGNADAPGRLRFARRQHQGKDIREVRIVGRPTPKDRPTARDTLTELYLYAREHDEVQTVVLDPLARIHDLVLDDIGGQRPTLQDRGDAGVWLERYVGSLLELPVNLVLVAHDLGYKVATTEGGDETFELFPFCGSKSNPGLAKNLMRPLDVVAYCGVVTAETETELFPAGTHVAQLFHGGGRQGADGLGVLGDVAELDLSAWVAANREAAGPAGGTEKSKSKSQKES
jgi:hypothetical protein